jgi:hypothetical protein
VTIVFRYAPNTNISLGYGQLCPYLTTSRKPSTNTWAWLVPISRALQNLDNVMDEELYVNFLSITLSTGETAREHQSKKLAVNSLLDPFGCTVTEQP